MQYFKMWHAHTIWACLMLLEIPILMKEKFIDILPKHGCFQYRNMSWWSMIRQSITHAKYGATSAPKNFFLDHKDSKVPTIILLCIWNLQSEKCNL